LVLFAVMGAIVEVMRAVCYAIAASGITRSSNSSIV
jgi:hypothetical protein